MQGLYSMDCKKFIIKLENVGLVSERKRGVSFEFHVHSLGPKSHNDDATVDSARL